MAGTLFDGLSQKHPSLRRRLNQTPRLRAVLRRLERERFGGVFDKYLDGASTKALLNFLRACAGLDWRHVNRHREELRRQAEPALCAGNVEPVNLVTIEQQRALLPEYVARGEQALERGLLASVAFSGGSGTRFFTQLGELDHALEAPNLALQESYFASDCPKGCFPISPVAGLSFYQMVLAEALEAGVRHGRLPWVLFLTSQATGQKTTGYLSRCTAWGFPRRGWLAFRQARVPRLDRDGDLIVEDDQGNLSLTGDGHGGVYRALFHTSLRGRSLIDQLARDGVRHLVMHNIDNAAARPFFPARIGFHLAENAVFTLSAVRKTDPREKVGLVMKLLRTGRIEVVEYNQLDENISRAPGAEGRLLFDAGNTNTSLVALDAIRADIQPTLYTGKLVPSRRGLVEASSFEMLNQHLTRQLDPNRIRAFEVERSEFFLPTKNIIGPDSVQTTMKSLAERGRKRLRQAGALVHEQALVDLHPCCGEVNSLAGLGAAEGWQIDRGARLYLCLAPAGDEPFFRGGITLEPDAMLVIESSLPYGGLSLRADRRLKRDVSMAGTVSVGKGVVVKKGVQVRILVGRGAHLEVPSGTVFSADLNLKLRPRQKASI